MIEKTREESFSIKILALMLTLIAGGFLLQILLSTLLAFADVFLVLFLAWLLSLLLSPLVSFFLSLRLARGVSVFAAYGVATVLVFLFLFGLVPTLIAQFSRLAQALPLYLEGLNQTSSGLQTFFDRTRLPIKVSELAQSYLLSFQSFSVSALASSVEILQGLFSALFSLAFVFLLSFYLLLDGPRMGENLAPFVPTSLKDEIGFLQKLITSSFKAYLFSQVVLGVLWGTGVGVLFWLFGFEYAVSAATFAGIGMSIPFFNLILGLLAPLLFVLLAHPQQIVLVFLVLLLGSYLYLNFVGPLLTADFTGLHPAWALLAILIGFKLGGPWGAIFAVPVAAILYQSAREFLPRLKK